MKENEINRAISIVADNKLLKWCRYLQFCDGGWIKLDKCADICSMIFICFAYKLKLWRKCRPNGGLCLTMWLYWYTITSCGWAARKSLALNFVKEYMKFEVHESRDSHRREENWTNKINDIPNVIQRYSAAPSNSEHNKFLFLFLIYYLLLIHTTTSPNEPNMVFASNITYLFELLLSIRQTVLRENKNQHAARECEYFSPLEMLFYCFVFSVKRNCIRIMMMSIVFLIQS